MDQQLLEVRRFSVPPSGAFSGVGSLNTPSQDHTATLLNGGRALVVGGADNCNTCTSPILLRSETFSTSTNLFSVGPNLAVARQFHTATLLNSGAVLVVGGQPRKVLPPPPNCSTPRINHSITAGSLRDARDGHTATLLNDGTVLVVGGNGLHGTLASAELYAVTPPTPAAVKVTPTSINMNVGGSTTVYGCE